MNNTEEFHKPEELDIESHKLKKLAIKFHKLEKLDIKFHKLEELATEFEYEINKFISLLAKWEIPIFIAANNWYGHIWKKPFIVNDLYPNDPMEDFNLLKDATLVTPLEKPIKLNHSLVKLKNSTLVAYQLNKITNVGAFEANDMVNDPEEFIFEFRLCNPNDYSKPFEIILNNHDLVVKNYSMSIIEKLLSKEPNQNESNLKESEKTKLLKTIGALAMIITESSDKFKSGKKTNVSQIQKEIVEEMDEIIAVHPEFIEKYGIGPSSLRAAISAGLKKLIAK